MRNIDRIRNHFSADDLGRVCIMPEEDFGDAYEMERVEINQPGPENFYFFKDNGSDVLAVAHLDTVGWPEDRAAHFVETEGGLVVFSRALDDRLGAYIILELLPRLGLQYDILLTVGEESGSSTAQGFTTDKEYRYLIEFDRGGTDVVMYDYEDDETRAAVRRCGAWPAEGIFSDISYMEHLGVKGWNWGVGYEDYHGPRAHAFLDDTFGMLDHYLTFARQNEGVFWPHEPSRFALMNFDRLTADEADSWGDDEHFDEDGIYFDREYVENPTPEQLRQYAERSQRLWQ